jgi:hypothetical protein
MAKITVAFMRDVYSQMLKEEITYSRMVEMLNEKAQEKWYENEKILNIISIVAGGIAFGLVFLYYQLPEKNLAYLLIILSIYWFIVGLCDYQKAKVTNKMYSFAIIKWVISFILFIGFISLIL